MAPPPMEVTADPAPVEAAPEAEAPPAAEPPETSEPVPPSIGGVWTSAWLQGPGSAGFDRVDAWFLPDGVFVLLAREEGGLRTGVGRYREAEGVIDLEFADGRCGSWELRHEPPEVLLRDGECELRLVRSSGAGAEGTPLSAGDGPTSAPGKP